LPENPHISSAQFNAIVVERPGGVDALELTRLSRHPLRTSDVRIRVEAAGVNPVDAGNRADPSWAGIAPPYVVGYECSGVVLEVGEKADHLREGDDVWAHLPVRGTRWGTYAEELVADGEFVACRPTSLSPLEAAALPLAGSTAMQLLDRLDLASGEWILVHGAAGGVGHLFVQLAQARGARVAVVASPARHDLLRSLGVEVVVDRFQDDAIRLARDEAGTDFDVAVDLVGQRLLAASLPFIAEGGRAATIVELTGDFEEAVDRNLTIHGLLVRPSRVTLQQLEQLVLDGSLHPLIDDVIPLEECRRAHARLETRSGQGKVVLVVTAAQ
jgi:NADPH2:quinone reductase